MNVNTLFPSRYLKGEDLAGKEYALTIRQVTMEKMGKDQEEHPVVWFNEAKKGMVLKKTNALTIANLYGPETTSWTGKRIVITSRKVNAFGGMQDVVTVLNRVPAPPQPKEEAPPSPAPGPKETPSAERWEQQAHLRKIAALASRHDSIFDESSDVTDLRQVIALNLDDDDGKLMPTTVAPGKATSMYQYLCDLIDKAVGLDHVAEPILTYLFGRVISTETPPELGPGRYLLDDLMGSAEFSDIYLAVHAAIKEHLP